MLLNAKAISIDVFVFRTIIDLQDSWQLIDWLHGQDHCAHLPELLFVWEAFIQVFSTFFRVHKLIGSTAKKEEEKLKNMLVYIA